MSLHSFGFFYLAFNTCKDQTVNISILKKKNQCMYHFAINTFNTNYIHKHLYKCTHLFIRTRPMGHFAQLPTVSEKNNKLEDFMK